MKRFINYPFGNTELDFHHRSKKIFAVTNEEGFNSRKIINTCVYKKDPLKCIPYIERIDQSSHNHYSVCFCMLIEKAAEIETDEKVQIIRTIILELERIYSHILYLDRMFSFCENDILLNLTSTIKDTMLDCFEEITGHRMYSASHMFGDIGFNMSSGNIKFINNTVEETKKNTDKIKKITTKNPSLISLFKYTAAVSKEVLSNNKVSGPFSWTNKTNHDLRSIDPYLVYGEKEIQEILRNKYIADENNNCILSRITSVSYDIENSIKIIKLLLEKFNPVYHKKNTLEYKKPKKGAYTNKIEAPRGVIEITTLINKDGLIDDLKIISPSDVNKSVLNTALNGTLVDYTQLAFESLYLSMMEIDK